MKPAPSSPCRECPFRRVAPNGYLGAATPENFIKSTLATEIGMPCHLTVDYEEKDWLATLDEKASLCRGSLIFLRNSCKLPRSSAYAAAVLETPVDRNTVFGNSAEFLLHHQSPVRPPVRKNCGKAAKKGHK